MSGSDDSLCTIISCGALPFVAPVAFCPDASLVVRLVDILLAKSSHTIFCFGGISIAKVQYVYLLRQIAVFVFIRFTRKFKCKLWPKTAKISVALQWLHARMTELHYCPLGRWAFLQHLILNFILKLNFKSKIKYYILI